MGLGPQLPGLMTSSSALSATAAVGAGGNGRLRIGHEEGGRDSASGSRQKQRKEDQTPWNLLEGPFRRDEAVDEELSRQ